MDNLEDCGVTMRFWTAFQAPLHQAALIENGKVVCAIPDHAAKTPVRMVGPIGAWDENHLLIGRRCSIEQWTADGKEMVRQVYHPWIYGLHVVQRYGDLLLLGCAGPDCAFLIDWEGTTHWSWFACKDRLSAPLSGFPVPFGEGQVWAAFQLTRTFGLPGSTHLNSISVEPDLSLLVTLCYKQGLVKLPVPVLGYQEHVSGKVVETTGHLRHDGQYDRRGGGKDLVVGLSGGISVNGNLLHEHHKFPYVKRIVQFGEDEYLFTHDTGMIRCKRDGKVLDQVALPRPWHVVFPEM